jgi:AGCS family alanine or glycine:cation symporter
MLILGMCGSVGLSQDAESIPAASETPVSEPAVGTNIVAAGLGTGANIAEVTPPASAFGQVDNVFKTLVGQLEQVLFYRLGKTSRRYVVYSHMEPYVRDRGTTGPFIRVHQLLAEDAVPGHPSSRPELSQTEVQLLQVQGFLATGHVIDGVQRAYRLGTFQGREVEYIEVNVPYPLSAIGETARTLQHGMKFVYVDSDQLYHLVGPKRGLLETDFVLTDSEVETLDEEGLLQRVATPVQPGDPLYLQQELVGGIPLVVAWLALGAVYFTIYLSGFNIWGFRHAVDVVRGKYDNPLETGEVTHFQALSSALSGTVGLGNIGGVTTAMLLGGPGAFFWMMMCGFFGMSSKFTECTLAVKYRSVDPDGHVLGGPMKYLRLGLAERGLPGLGAVLSIAFTIMCVLASFGGGNMYQANQSGAAMLQMLQQHSLQDLADLKQSIRDAAARGDATEVEELQAQRREQEAQLAAFEGNFKLVYGLVLASLVAVVIIGGIKRIGRTAEKLVPSMCLIYVAACLFIIVSHITRLPELIMLVFTEAWNARAMGGGFLGVLVIGVQRAAFSNEAGAGSAAIAHSAAKTEEPIREGCVALLEPFIDTIVVCSMTALVILITGAWDRDDWVVDKGLAGAALTVEAFRAEISWFPYILGMAVTLFAYSTIISWSYYGERCWEMLFGRQSTPIYKVLTVVCVFIGTIVNLGSVLDFSDMMILGMAFPNIAGLFLLAPVVRKELRDYWTRYRNGEFPVASQRAAG